MESKFCDNCQVLAALEADRIKWYGNLATNNISLHKQLLEQQSTIMHLRKQLLEKRSTIISDTVTESIKDLKKSPEAINAVVLQKLDQVADFLETIRQERVDFDKQLDEYEREQDDNISYLNGLVESFRETLFNELDKSNKTKRYFIKQLSGVTEMTRHILLESLKSEQERINTGLRNRYKNTLEQSRQEIGRQQQTIAQLRKYNRQLYLVVHKTKCEAQAKIESNEEHIRSLQRRVAQLKQKNKELFTQFKLQVAGCQQDIFDAKKTLKKLSKT